MYFKNLFEFSRIQNPDVMRKVSHSKLLDCLRVRGCWKGDFTGTSHERGKILLNPTFFAWKKRAMKLLIHRLSSINTNHEIALDARRAST